MRYRIYLYRTTAAHKGALCIDIVNRAVSQDSKFDWEGNSADKFMLNFDAERVKDEILTRLTVNGDKLCRAEVLYSPQNKIEYIYIATSYETAKNVLTEVNAVAVNHELIMYDAEMDRAFYTTDLYCKPYVTMKLRSKQLNNLILQTQQPIRRLREIDFTSEESMHSCSFVITFIKDGATLEERTLNFYETLKSNLLKDEELHTGFECFTVCGDEYEIIYCLEGYKNCADKIGYMENGVPCTSLVKRMPCELAVKQCEALEKCEQRDVYARMRFSEWINRYPNPAERFVASVNLAKRIRREKLDIAVSSIGYYGSQILFHVAVDEYVAEEPQRISVLKIEEDTASFILPVLEMVYPYIDARYYTINHLPAEMMTDIVEKIKEIRKRIVNNTYDEKAFSIYSRSCLWALEDASEDDELKYTDPNKFIYNHRYKIARLYDIFVSWVEDQLEYYGGRDGLMFNIQGP